MIIASNGIFSPSWPSLENILPELKTVLPNADFVIEGYVDPTELYPVLHITAITHRKDAGVDVHNTSEVLFHLTANTDPQRDSIFTKGPWPPLIKMDAAVKTKVAALFDS